jgi:hypothetical protein
MFDLVLDRAQVEVGDSVQLGGVSLTVIDKSHLVRLRHSFWLPSPKPVFAHIASLLREAGQLSDGFTQLVEDQERETRHVTTRSENKRKLQELSQGIADATAELDATADEPSVHSEVYELEPNRVVQIQIKKQKFLVCALGEPQPIPPVSERLRMASVSDLTTDGVDLFVSDRFNSNARWCKRSSSSSSSQEPVPVDELLTVPTPAPLVRIMFDPETEWTFGLQTDPPRLWKFQLLPRHCQAAPAAPHFVSLCARRSAVFGCLWFNGDNVYVCQSPGFGDEDANHGCGIACFNKLTLARVPLEHHDHAKYEEDLKSNADGCSGTFQSWISAELETPLPAECQEKDMLAVCEARQPGTATIAVGFADSDRFLLSTRGLWTFHPLPDGVQPAALCWRSDQLFALASIENCMKIVHIYISK